MDQDTGPFQDKLSNPPPCTRKNEDKDEDDEDSLEECHIGSSPNATSNQMLIKITVSSPSSYHIKSCQSHSYTSEGLTSYISELGVFAILPGEMTLHILSFLPFEDVLLNISCLNKHWKKLVEDDGLWKCVFAQKWKKDVQEEEEKRKLRKKDNLKNEFEKKKKKLHEEYVRRVKQLEEEYHHKKSSYKRRRKKEKWRYLFENRFMLEKYWKSGKAWLQTLQVGRTINCLLFDEDKNTVICGNHSADGQGGEIRYWDIKKGICFKIIPAHDRWVRGLFWVPSQDRLFSCSNDKTIKVWDVESGELLTVYEGHENNVPMIQLCMKNQMMISCSRDQTVKIWDIEKHVCIQTFVGHSHAVNCVQFNNDNAIVSGDRGGFLKIWDVRTNVCEKTISTGLDVVQCFAFTKEDGHAIELVLGGGSSKRDEHKYPFEVWDLSMGNNCVNQLNGHTGFNWAMQYDAKTKKLVTGGADKSIRVWNMKTYECASEVSDRAQGGVVGAGTVRGGNRGKHSDSIYTLHFSESKIVSGSKDKTLKIWKFGKARKT